MALDVYILEGRSDFWGIEFVYDTALSKSVLSVSVKFKFCSYHQFKAD